jgi:hypothetical protein
MLTIEHFRHLHNATVHIDDVLGSWISAVEEVTRKSIDIVPKGVLEYNQHNNTCDALFNPTSLFYDDITCIKCKAYYFVF